MITRLFKSKSSDYDVNIKPYTLPEFIEVTQVNENFADMTNYTKDVFESFRNNLNANAKSHTHLQFAPANAKPKIAKEYVFANARQDCGKKKASVQQCIKIIAV